MINQLSKRTKHHKAYIIRTYSEYWIKAVKKYGIGKYEKAFLNLLKSRIEKGAPNIRILEVAMGTSWPFAINLATEGYNVYGMDLSEFLLQKGKMEFGSRIKCFQSDAEELSIKNEVFDLTYCVRSTWYLKNINTFLDEIFRVTKKRGYVIFDIMNRRNFYIWFASGNLYTSTLRLVLVNFKRILTRKHLTSLYCPEIPSDPSRIYPIINGHSSKTETFFCDLKRDSIHSIPIDKTLKCRFPRIVYVCQKS